MVDMGTPAGHQQNRRRRIFTVLTQIVPCLALLCYICSLIVAHIQNICVYAFSVVRLDYMIVVLATIEEGKTKVTQNKKKF